MKRTILGFIALCLLLAGCGGGGGGGTGAVARLQGYVVLVGTGTRPDPPAQVISGGATTQTSSSDGSFTIQVVPTTRTIKVRATGFPEFEFTLPALRANQTYDLGELYIGPQQVVVRARVLDALDNSPVVGANVTLQGDRVVTDTEGRFIFNKVAYDSEGAFDSEGLVEASGGTRSYIPQPFVVDVPPISGEISLPDILMAPESSTNPPPLPANVTGKVTASGGVDVLGTRIDIYRPTTATTPLRSSFVLNANGDFGVWLSPGVYRIQFVKTRSGGLPPLIAERTVTVTSSTQNQSLGSVALN